MNTEIGTNVEKASEILRSGGLVGIPTETVYGLAGNALNTEAVYSIFRVKQRPLGNPLILHLHDFSQLQSYVTAIPDAALRLMKKFSPGPLTYLLPKSGKVSDLITAGSEFVAVRFPDHPLTLALLKNIDFPVVAPSANKYTHVSPTLAEHVKKELDGEIAYVLDGGPCKKGIESTVIGFENDKVVIYRPGIVTEQQLSAEGFEVVSLEKKSGPVHSPGLSALHYSPRTPLFICKNLNDAIEKNAGKKIAIIAFSEVMKSIPVDHQFILSESKNPEEAASKLYAALHLMDEQDNDIILTEFLPDEGVGKAVNDRLKRAGKLFD